MSPKPRTEFDTPDQSRGQTTLDFAIGMSVFLIAVAFVISFVPGLLDPFSGGGTEDTVTANRVATALAEDVLVEDTAEPYVLDRACTILFFAPEHSDGVPDNNQDLRVSNDNAMEPGTRENGAMFNFENDTDDAWLDHDGDNNADCNFGTVDPWNVPYLHERLGVAGIGADGDIQRSLSPNMEIVIRGDLNDNGDSHLLCLEANDDPDGSADPDLESPIIENDPDESDIDDADPYDAGGRCAAVDGDYDIPFSIGQTPPQDSSSVVTARRLAVLDGERVEIIVKIW